MEQTESRRIIREKKMGRQSKWKTTRKFKYRRYQVEWCKLYYNVSKKRGSLTTKLSDALFNALHRNIEVNQSAYKKQKTKTKL
jgi:hypothetical protein